ncbi:MAG: hypothetical protein ACJ789_08365 [Thermomicrobiales bacterium]
MNDREQALPVPAPKNEDVVLDEVVYFRVTGLASSPLPSGDEVALTMETLDHRAEQFGLTKQQLAPFLKDAEDALISGAIYWAQTPAPSAPRSRPAAETELDRLLAAIQHAQIASSMADAETA